MKITCIIVEDEPLAMEKVKRYVARIPFLQLKGTFDNGIDALVFIKANPVDLLLLDINTGELSGIQLLEASKTRSRVIITTAYPEYALKGYELNVTDYLLKPYTFERFFQAIEKVQDALAKPGLPTGKKYIFIKTEYRLEKIDLSDILYIQGMGDYRQVHLVNNKRVMTLQTFREFEKQIDPAILCRVHKSYMVAIGKITSVERDEININGVIIPVSETYKKSFYELIRGLGGE